MSDTLHIDKEFAGLCPDLTPEEITFLEASLTADGCRDPIIVWANHDDTILDGHHRYRLCERLKIPYKTKALKFDIRGEATNWIIANQLGRRNLTDEQKIYLRGKQFRSEKKMPGERTDLTSGQNGPRLPVADRLAETHGVSVNTIKRDAAFADAIDTIAEVQGPEAKAKILAGKSNLGKADVVKASKLPPKKMAKALEAEKSKGKKKKGQPTSAEEIENGLHGYRLLMHAIDFFELLPKYRGPLDEMRDFLKAKQKEIVK